LIICRRNRSPALKLDKTVALCFPGLRETMTILALVHAIGGVLMRTVTAT
jgi:hypothetical protein